MITKDISIPTNGRPIEAFAMYGEAQPSKALLILPGRGYTINHFVLDIIWRMAAEKGFYSVKAEYRGYTYRHLDEPYEIKDAVRDVEFMFDYLNKNGFEPQNILVCAKSLGTIALANFLAANDLVLDKAILLTPVVYYAKEKGIIPVWQDYLRKVRESLLVFGSVDPFCDIESAATIFSETEIKYYRGADHGLHLEGNYKETINIQTEIIETVKDFISR